MPSPTREWVFAAGDRAVPWPDTSISRHFLADETEAVAALVADARLPDADAARVTERARALVEAMRARRAERGGLDAFMSEYDLSSTEGVVLMCLAEALLRIPDADTADKLIADKLGDADFQAHLGTSESLFVNATTWALMLTGHFVADEPLAPRRLGQVLARIVGRLGEPVIRTALRQAMRIVGRQFVMGRDIGDALERARRGAGRRYRYSFDMLGEAALTAADADVYVARYAGAIDAVGAAAAVSGHPADAPGVSVKLSALSPRFELGQWRRATAEIGARLERLAGRARDAGVALTVDAEEADRLDLTLAIFRRVYESSALAGRPGLGIAVQAYQKRGRYVLDWLAELARKGGRTIPVRLVKGAYWDTEIKRAQEQGLSGYPVFTRKSSTDVSYLACARRLLDAAPSLYPQFATHNALTVAWLEVAGAGVEFEFQRLHGMGEDLYAGIVGAADGEGRRPCRVYAPVGSHEDLLPYLVRRLLENGANTSFVNRFVDEDASVDELIRDPVPITDELLAAGAVPHPSIPLPRDLYGDARRNSAGLNLADPLALEALAERTAAHARAPRRAAPVVDGRVLPGTPTAVRDPARTDREIGVVELADAATARFALDCAAAAFPAWNALRAEDRAERLRQAADLVESHREELAALIVAEGARTVPNCLAEIREAVDFLRYYAAECERLFAASAVLVGPTGELNRHRLLGRGVFVCVSPWNFPVAIFTGQVAAALAAGNTVIAKPAEATSLVAARVVELLHEGGIPAAALAFLPGAGPEMADALLADPRVAGVAFTGSIATAKRIERALAGREGPVAALIAETGGVNAMIVDSSALPEQVVRDTLVSAFDSAGQRCSALRVLCVQSDAAEPILEMLTGAMAELSIGDPALLSTDVGPVIGADAKAAFEAHVAGRAGRLLYRRELGPEHAAGHYFPPTLIELDAVTDLTREVFGPVLHVVRYEAADIDGLVDAINDLGFGLTLGIHSRIDAFAERIARRARVGNVYVNRNMIGAVVGVQPFGGMGLSGTGPKAGGPEYLRRFATEQTVSINTAAIGGNTTLMSLAADVNRRVGPPDRRSS